MPRHAAKVDVVELGEGIARAGVLRLGVAIEIETAGLGVDGYVLQDGAEGAGGGVDLRLPLGGEADDLGVAPALDVEPAVVAPAVLVVADQRPAGIGREGRLAGAGEAEEQ